MGFNKKVVKLFSSNIIDVILSFVGLTIFANQLTPGGIGQYFLFITVLEITAIFADFGIDEGARKRVSEPGPSGEYLSAAILSKVVNVSVMAVPIVVAGRYVDNYIGLSVVPLLVGTLYVQELGKVNLNTIHGELRAGVAAIIPPLNRLVWVVTGAAFLRAGYGPISLVYAYIAGQVVLLVVGYVLKNTKAKWPKMHHFKSIYRYSFWDFVSTISGRVLNRTDIFLIGVFLTQTIVGGYEVAWKVAGITMLFSNAFSLIIHPKISSLAEDDQVEKLVQDGIVFSLMIISPSVFGAALFSTEILTLLFGSEYAIASTVMIVLVFERIFRSVHEIFIRTIQGLDYPEYGALGALIAAISNVVLNLVLIHPFGALGVAIGTAIAWSINALVDYRFLREAITFRMPKRTTAWTVAAAASTLLPGLLIKSAFEINSIPKLISAILTCAVFYVILIIVNSNTRSLLLSLRSDLI